MTSPIVAVGVDSSQTALDACRWAAREAALRHATLRIVHAWSYPYIAAPLAASVVSDEEMQAAAREVAEEAAAEVRSSNPELEIEIETAAGPATAVLVAASKEADLLVVGSRGLGGFAELALGSVSHYCVHHAHCPVVVVPHREAA